MQIPKTVFTKNCFLTQAGKKEIKHCAIFLNYYLILFLYPNNIISQSHVTQVHYRSKVCNNIYFFLKKSKKKLLMCWFGAQEKFLILSVLKTSG